jgi:hypothetical protein
LWGASTPFLDFYLKKIGICFPTKKKTQKNFCLGKKFENVFPKRNGSKQGVRTTWLK